MIDILHELAHPYSTTHTAHAKQFARKSENQETKKKKMGLDDSGV